jgi:hypothetical protein
MLSRGSDYVMKSNMSSQNFNQLKEVGDNRAVWERPAFRRLVTEDAEGGGFFQSEGTAPTCANPGGPNAHSCKNA